MARINVKLDDVDSGFQVYPDMKVIVKIQESSKTTMSKEGNPKILWIGKIIEPEEYVDKLYSWDTSLLPQALFKLKGMLEAMGIPWDDDGFEMEDCLGEMVGIVNQVKQYKEEDRNNAVSFFGVNKT
jgi:hypothetical protein